MISNNLFITAVGTISSLGNDFKTLTENLGKAPVPQNVKSFQFHELEQDVPCCRVTGYEPKEVLGKKGLRTKDWSTKLLLGSMEQIFVPGFQDVSEQEKPGIVAGTAFGSVQSIGDFLSDSIENGVNAVNPMHFANTVINSPTGNANIRYGVKNLSATIASGFNAGLDALIYTSNYILSGYMDKIVTGGLEEISYYSLLGLQLSGVLSLSGLSRPFAQDSDGLVPGEGCAVFLVETEESALKGNRKPLVEIAGYANVFDPSGPVNDYNIHGEGARRSMQDALSSAGIDADDIAFVAASANGIRSGDTMEAEAIKEVIGEVPVSAYKSFTGECYGASPSLNTACAIADLQNRRATGVPYEYELRSDVNLVKNSVKEINKKYALINSFSCDGNCSSLVLKRPE